MSIKDRVARRAESARQRWPVLDRGVRTQQHYTWVNGSALAGGVTYYGFLSFFPILAVAFFVVGRVARVFPEARDKLVTWVDQAMPGIVGTDQGEISISTIERAATTAGIIGLLGLLYTGLMWLSMMRRGLQVVFDVPRNSYPSFVGGKARDLVAMVILGVILVVSVGITGAVVGFSDSVLDLLGLGQELTWLVNVVGAMIGVLANIGLFYAFFWMLARPPLPPRVLLEGAVLGGLAFEVLKEASSYLLTLTQRSPAFQAYGIALILLVWINYFSRIVMYSAAWAVTAPGAPGPVTLPAPSVTNPSATLDPPSGGRRLAPRAALGAGAAVTLGLMAVVRRRR